MLLKRGEQGASLLEYALLAALVALVGIVSIDTFGAKMSGRYSSMADSVQPAEAGGSVDSGGTDNTPMPPDDMVMN